MAGAVTFPSRVQKFFLGSLLRYVRLDVILQEYHFLPADQRKLSLDECCLHSLKTRQVCSAGLTSFQTHNNTLFGWKEALGVFATESLGDNQ
ncbi:unnamed protein product [Acanthoscelides obtectus]|uniref:Uncharacterized protein n=1 Tax=Acanthoscelides obtectus TaxID=200917 RepID=A0A9P0PFI8_ACAOB|nr:unnamed protein product [Acanthoscelides obtectus]CAK1671011.1 hypothetical protein AOBTE_LOCUS27980 [Acanthoscelides obtectus]